MTKKRRAFSVSIYCRHVRSVLLVKHKRLGIWVPVGGELEDGETPLEAARRELREETGWVDVTFPMFHKVVGAPPGLLLYEEHDAGSKGLHMNFAFVAEVPEQRIPNPCAEYTGTMWVESYTDLPAGVPPNVREAMVFALTAGIV